MKKGQRESIIYGNDVKTNYRYDPDTFRLTQLFTKGKNGTDDLQNLFYTYDPVGNIVSIKDEAQQTIFYNNAVVNPSCDYTYDAIYQLTRATGREHIGQNQLPNDNWQNETFTNLIHKGDGNAMRHYVQNYVYDEVGNIMQLRHTANGGSYTRNYAYESANNRIRNTKIGERIFECRHDVHGNIDQMQHLSLMEWSFKDQLHSTQQTVADSGTGERTYYVYDGAGQRTRKVTERQGTANKKEERIYLGGFEIYRSYKPDGTSIELERETLHVTDDKSKIAPVETKIRDDESNDETELNKALIRYQLGNHVGSACLELDKDAAIVSYEEYHPYGTTSYHALDKNINPIAKRYRYTGMERDEESGFEYHSARYYLPWLGRWLSADPIGIEGGLNLYNYVDNRVLTFNDASGKDKATVEKAAADIKSKFKEIQETKFQIDAHKRVIEEIEKGALVSTARKKELERLFDATLDEAKTAYTAYIAYLASLDQGFVKAMDSLFDEVNKVTSDEIKIDFEFDLFNQYLVSKGIITTQEDRDAIVSGCVGITEVYTKIYTPDKLKTMLTYKSKVDADKGKVSGSHIFSVHFQDTQLYRAALDYLVEEGKVAKDDSFYLDVITSDEGDTTRDYVPRGDKVDVSGWENDMYYAGLMPYDFGYFIRENTVLGANRAHDPDNGKPMRIYVSNLKSWSRRVTNDRPEYSCPGDICIGYPDFNREVFGRTP